MQKSCFPFVLALVLSSALTQAKEKNPHWLSNSDIQTILKKEPPPPVAGSEAEKADLQAELDAQTKRTPSQIAEARRDEGYSVKLFTSMIGPRITAASDPLTFQLFDDLNGQVAEVVHITKDHWQRPRPYQAHPEIHALFPVNGFSYPSGHSMHSFAFAIVLGDLFPDKAAAFMNRAHQIAQSRVDAGVHYTTDIRQGETDGTEVVKELMTKPAFLQEFHAAQAELAGKK